jgi:hypothetical protein
MPYVRGTPKRGGSLMKMKDLVGKTIKILDVGTSTILAEISDGQGQLIMIESYCACNSGFWYLMASEVSDKDLVMDDDREGC